MAAGVPGGRLGPLLPATGGCRPQALLNSLRCPHGSINGRSTAQVRQPAAAAAAVVARAAVAAAAAAAVMTETTRRKMRS